ncbi:MAG: metal-dependent hydrolase [Kiritimatiellae bacterium]|nr:metal-dependent hydrolase [Kiritimatiellia bacterium]
MKGISHFVSGVMAASFCPWAVEAATEGNPLYFVLGGAFGILPDTIDFKFYRFFYRHDFYVDPDPQNPDPQAIADALAQAVDRARTAGRAVRIKLNTVRMGADYWRQYVVRFDAENQEVQVRIGPVVNTGQVPVPGSEPGERAVGRAKLSAPIVQTYDATTRVDIFDGPTFALEADEQGRVVLHFLPWHRNWSHSFLVGGVWALLGWLVWNWQAAVVILAGYAAHLIEDQLGFMGSNLFFPITKKRFMGLHVMRSGDAIPNFSAVWLSCLLIFWNLYRMTPGLRYHFNFLQLIVYGAVIPIGLFGVVHWLLTRGGKEQAAPVELEDEFGDTMTT